VYKEKGFEIQSLNSLVRIAKQRTCKRIEDLSDRNVKLPLHHVTERLMESLQQMHHQLQNLMMQNLGSDARNVITAERARQARVDNQHLEAQTEKDVEQSRNDGYIARHLSEVGQLHGADELELLNEYRKQYAAIMAELLVAKERLLKLETGLRDYAPDGALRRRMSEEIEELIQDDLDGIRGRWKSSEW
jgi:hypothetical protein